MRRRVCDRRSLASLRSPAFLKRFVRFAHIARASFEAREFFQERERNLAYRTVALLRDDQFGLASFFHTRLFVFLIEFWPDEQGDQISVLFNRTRFAEIAQPRFATRALLRLPIQLRHHN